ncbi:MAG TPA: hypothetical protein VKT28_22440 [Puia sp.]|nr:hypothetical protein [Puia sp.]
MKALFCFVIIIVSGLFSCKKSSSDASIVNQWQLVQENWSIGAGSGVTKPSADSSVLLILHSNYTYSSLLNGNIICQGTYSVSTNASDSEKDLQLNNFKTTGIFSLFTLYQIGQNGQVISTSDAFSFNISNGTLTLSGPLTPGGNISYTFVKI